AAGSRATAGWYCREKSYGNGAVCTSEEGVVSSITARGQPFFQLRQIANRVLSDHISSPIRSIFFDGIGQRQARMLSSASDHCVGRGLGGSEPEAAVNANCSRAAYFG